jgi:hypothetical protein
MLIQACELCGRQLRVVGLRESLKYFDPSYCPECEQVRNEAKRSTANISETCDAIVSSLKEKGNVLVVEVKTFENQLITDMLGRIKIFEGRVIGEFEGHAEKLLNDHFASLEEQRKEVKDA